VNYLGGNILRLYELHHKTTTSLLLLIILSLIELWGTSAFAAYAWFYKLLSSRQPTTAFICF